MEREQEVEGKKKGSQIEAERRTRHSTPEKPEPCPAMLEPRIEPWSYGGMCTNKTRSAFSKEGCDLWRLLDHKHLDPKICAKFTQSSVSQHPLPSPLSFNSSTPSLPIAFPLYARISETPWYSWNPKIVAELAALLDKHEQYSAWETLILEATSKLESCSRDLALFYCKLFEYHSMQSSERGFEIAYSYLSHLLHSSSSSIYIRCYVYEYMVSGLCSMGRPCEAENLVKDMRIKGLEPSAFEFNSIMYGYGRLGLFEDLERIILQMEKEGFVIDTVCSIMVLSAYGMHGEHTKMVSCLQRMRNSSIIFSVRTYNSVLNSCPVIMRKLVDLNGFPLSIKELKASLEGDEAKVVGKLTRTT